MMSAYSTRDKIFFVLERFSVNWTQGLQLNIASAE